MMDLIEFGAYLRELRKKRGLTLVDLNKLSGVSQPYLSQIENGKAGSSPSPEILRKIAEPLGADYSDLMEKAGYMTSTEIMSEVDLIEALFFMEIKSNWARELNFILENLTDEDKEFFPFINDQINNGWLTGFLKERFGDQFILSPKSLIDLCRKIDFEDLRGRESDFHTSIMELLDMLKIIAEEACDSTELEYIVSKSEITYGGISLDKKDRKRIIDMLEVLFRDRN